MSDSPLFVDEDKHCDSYISRISAPKCLRWFLFVNRLPAVDMHLLLEKIDGYPKLFAKYEGEWVRVVMASRFGDVGITSNLDADSGYDKGRVTVDQLSDFTDQRPT